MNSNIIFGLLIIFLVLIIILLILLLIYPDITLLLGIGLTICSIITGIIGYVYVKNTELNRINSCTCGKGECAKCGGIDISNKQLKDDFNTLIELLRVDGPYSRENYDLRKTEFNNYLVTKLQWVECGKQEDPMDFLNKIFGELKQVMQLNTGEQLYVYNLNKENDDYIIDETRLVISSLSNKLTTKENFDMIGLILHIGNTEGEGSGHYISIVQYADSWYLCDDETYTKLNFNSEDELFNYLKNNHSTYTIRAYLWKKQNKKLKNGPPFGLVNFGNICYSNSAIQLLLVTELLDYEDKEEVQQKSQPEDKIEELLIKEKKIIDTKEKYIPILDELINKITNLKETVYKIINDIPDKNGNIDNWASKNEIKNNLYKIHKEIKDRISTINNFKLEYFNKYITEIISDNEITKLTENIILVEEQFNQLVKKNKPTLALVLDTKLSTPTSASVPETKPSTPTSVSVPDTKPNTEVLVLDTKLSTVAPIKSTIPTTLVPISAPASIPDPGSLTTTVQASTPVSSTNVTMSSTISSSSLPIYEFSTGEIEEAWEKKLSSGKPKKIENTNTEYDQYLNKLLKEKV